MAKRERFPSEDELKAALKRLPFRESAGTELCLSSEKLEKFAAGKYADADIPVILDHLRKCDHCCEVLHNIHKLRVRTTRLRLSAAAACVLLLALAVWFAVSHSIRREQLQTVAVLDLRNLAPTRGIENAPSSSPVPVPRNVRTLQILLPVESEAGNYEIAVFGRDGKPVFIATAAAKLESGNVTIKVPVDFRNLGEDRYLLGLRHGESGWQYYPLALK